MEERESADDCIERAREPIIQQDLQFEYIASVELGLGGVGSDVGLAIGLQSESAVRDR